MKCKRWSGKHYVLLLLIIIAIIAAFLYLKTDSVQEQDSSASWDISSVASLRKLVFNLPHMDKQMCETFPRVILSTLESQDGVVDASFEYDGHVVTVYYDPQSLSRDDIVNNEIYSWVGTTFISEEAADVSKAAQLYADREENNDLKMPREHMLDVSDPQDQNFINTQEFPSLVSAAWLLKNKDNVKVIEIGPENEYNEEHVENAVNINIKEIRTTTNGVTKQVLTKESFEALMKQKGISPDDRVAVYSSTSLTHASRLFWTFAYYGHDNVALVDGGKDSIKKTFDLTSKMANKDISSYAAKVNEEIIVNSEYILKKLEDPNVILLDVRTKEEFEKGRIPGAINVDWTTMVNSDGTLKSVSELKVLLKDIDPSKEIIVYCVSGTRATYAWLVLSDVLKYPHVKLFDGSMIEWEYKKLPQES